jgi:hypothetical protein
MMAHEQKILLCFDVETTGFITGVGPNKIYPYVTQVSFVLYDLTNLRLMEIYNKYIDIPQDVPITEEITKLTGVTREKCNAGVSMVDAVQSFHRAWLMCTTAIAHNIDFDYKILQNEYTRNEEKLYIPMLFSCPNNWGLHPELFCTMKKTVNICKLPMKPKSVPTPTPVPVPSVVSQLRQTAIGDTIASIVPLPANAVKRPPYSSGYKNPKLSELYEFLFDETPQDLHNSLIDTLVCLKCYLRVRHSVLVDYRVEPVETDSYRVYVTLA